MIEVPGHTAGHIAYFTDSAPGAPILFCGDTLFSGGCGRVLRGHAGSRCTSRCPSSPRCPAITRVCCAHEYTLSNLKFARAVEPANQALLRLRGLVPSPNVRSITPTLPSSIERERAVNPFLRCAEPAV